MRTIMGELQPLEGNIRLGAAVKIGYLPQSQSWLDGPTPLLDYVLDHLGLSLQEARALLGRFLFADEDMPKPLAALSGGERSRLALAQLTLQGANLLILDEPTTHLDLAGQEVLQQVLMGFNGTILLVSHDRYLVNALATQIWWIEQGTMRQFEGNYTAFMQQLESEREKPADVPSASERDEWSEQKRRERRVERSQRDRLERIESLEARIARLEQEIKALDAAISRASESQNVSRVTQLSSQYSVLQQELDEVLSQWEAALGGSQ